MPDKGHNDKKTKSILTLKDIIVIGDRNFNSNFIFAHYKTSEYSGLQISEERSKAMPDKGRNDKKTISILSLTDIIAIRSVASLTKITSDRNFNSNFIIAHYKTSEYSELQISEETQNYINALVQKLTKNENYCNAMVKFEYYRNTLLYSDPTGKSLNQLSKEFGFGLLENDTIFSLHCDRNICLKYAGIELYVGDGLYFLTDDRISTISPKFLADKILKRTGKDIDVKCMVGILQEKPSTGENIIDSCKGKGQGINKTSTSNDINNNDGNGNHIFSSLFDGLENSFSKRNNHKQTFVKYTQSVIRGFSKTIRKTQLTGERNVNLIASVVTSKMFEDALFICNVEGKTITHTLLFTKECRMPLSFPVYWNGFINEKDIEYTDIRMF